MAESVRQLWGKKTDTVLGGATKVVDTVPLANFDRLVYEVDLFDTTSNKTKGFKMRVQNTDAGLNDQVSAKNGDPISIEIFAKVNGSDCEIELTNNETFDLGVSLVRLKL